MIDKLLVLIFVVVVVVESSSVEPVFFSELCEENGDAITDIQIKPHSHCVCFDAGTYDAHECGDRGSGVRTVVVPDDGICVQITPGIKSIALVGEPTEPNNNHHHDPITKYFEACQDNESNLKKRRKRRAAEGASTANVTDPLDEDFLSSGTEIGHEMMRNQMNQYMEGVIAKLTGLHGDGSGVEEPGKRTFPVLKLLDYSKKIMQRACQVVNPDFFDLALNSFINLQLETFHIKEPYIGYAAFHRIQAAMERCIDFADPFTFLKERDNGTDNLTEICETHVRDETTNVTILWKGEPGEGENELEIPPHGSSIINGTDIIAEPLIEAVWKMVVLSHSLCFMMFSDYFNDHHTYTVSLLPMFTNQIQEIWLKGYNAGNTTEKTKLYGGLLGDIKKTMLDVDRCVAVGRKLSPYPWFMNRPPLDKSNTWRRKKRSVSEEVPIDASSSSSSEEEVFSDRATDQHNVQFSCRKHESFTCPSS